MFDWQQLAVALIVAAALFYVARRALGRLRSFRRGGPGAASDCATGCGKCGEDGPVAAAPRVVQISRERTPPGRGRT
ncbi:MAG TPA: hypothetical protein VEY09_09120 [Pyrinomonadaceae bacterium]|nr:hypothetical protein [Pyrinomonadaceae bacterium]